MTAALAFLLLTAGQDRPEVVPPDPDSSRQLIRDAMTAYGLGVLHQRQDRLVEATRSLEEAVRLDPDAVPPRQLLIPLYTALGRPSDAARVAAAVVVIDPSQADTWRTLARLLHEMKRTGDAISVLHRCVAAPAMIERPADRIGAYRELARLYAVIGSHPQSANACRKALALMAENGPILLVKFGEPSELDRERAELNEMLAAASLGALQFVDARDAALEARDGYRKAKELDRAAAVAPKLAATYAGLKDMAKAHALLDDYLASQPRDVPAFSLKARLLRETGENPAALALLGRAVEKTPDCVPLRVLLGDECRRSGDAKRAEKAYRDAIALKPDVAAYRGLFAVLSGPGGNPLEMLNLIDGKVKEARPEKGNDNVTDGDRAAAAEQARAIVAALRQEPAAAGLVLTAAANDVRRGRGRFRGDGRAFETWWLLAGVAERTGQLTTAEQLLRSAQDTADPQQQFAIAEALIRVLAASRNHEAVIQECRTAIESRGLVQYRPYFLGRLASELVRTGAVKEALEQCDEAVRTAHGPQMLSEQIRRIGILSYAERFLEAEAACVKLLAEAKPPNEQRQVRLTLAHLYSTARQFEKAEEQLRIVIELDPADARAHNDLGYELADQGRRLDEAEQLVRRALELDRARKSDSLEDEGENAAYLDSLGWVLFRKGRFAEAKAAIEQAARMADAASDPVVWDHLGDVCIRLDQPAEAAAAWERARELYRTEKRTVNEPRGAEVERKLQRLK
jgi:tetratricopeptide (TPR) repeat protein